MKQHKPASAFGLAKLAVTKLELKWLKAFCHLRKHMPGYETSVGWLFFSGTQARISAHVKLALRALVGRDITVSDIPTALATYVSMIKMFFNKFIPMC